MPSTRSEILADSPTPPAGFLRWRRRLRRWLWLALLVGCAYGAWRVYDFRQAIKEAQTLGWAWKYDDPIDAIKKDWKAAFRIATWSDGEREVTIRTWQDSPEHRRLLPRLSPRRLQIINSTALRDLSSLEEFSGLRELHVYACPDLENIDALRSQPELTSLSIMRCGRIADLNALASLKKLRYVSLHSGSFTSLPVLGDLKELISLRFEDCPKLQNANGIKSLPALQDLAFYVCHSLSDLSGVAGLPALREFYILRCDALTNLNGLNDLPALQIFTVREAAGLQDIDGLTRTPRLGKLAFESCARLTNVDAIKSLNSLKTLEISKCPGLPKEQLAALKVSLPATEITEP